MVRETRKMIAVGFLTLLSVYLVSGAAVPPPKDPLDQKAIDNEASAGPNLTGEGDEETEGTDSKGGGDEFGNDDEIVLEGTGGGGGDPGNLTAPSVLGSSSSSMAPGLRLSESSGLPLQSTTVTQKSTNPNKEIKTDNIPKTSVDEVEKEDSVTEMIKDPKKGKQETGPIASPLVDEKQANENPIKENSDLKESNIKDEPEKPAIKEPENKDDVKEEKTLAVPKEELAKPPSDKMGGLSEEGKLPEAEVGVEDMREVTYKKNISPGGGEDVSQSNFLGYFIVLSIITIIAYLVFHNKKKILGLIVEGRGGRQAGRRRSGGREYRKLDSNMEDMLDSGKETSMRQVIY